MDAIGLLQGRRVLVVEDEMLIVMLVETMLADCGCIVVGPAHDVAGALEVLRTDADIDVALLDMNLGGQSVFEVADALRARHVPIVFSTGSGGHGLRDIDRKDAVLSKPFRAGQLEAALIAALRLDPSGQQ